MRPRRLSDIRGRAPTIADIVPPRGREYTFDPKQVRILHVHVKKTGGQTLNAIWERNFKLSRNYALAQTSYTQRDMETLLDNYDLSCFASHAFRLNTIPFDAHKKLRVFSIARNPVAQITSAYFFTRQQADLVPGRHPVRALKLPKLVEGLACGTIRRDGIFDSQLWQLTGLEDEHAALALVKRRIDEGRLFLFATERLDEARYLVSCLFQHKLKMDTPLRVNTSSHNQPVTAETSRLLASLPWVSADRELHAIANAAMDSLIVKLFGDVGAFKGMLSTFSVLNEQSRRRRRVR